MYVLLVYNFNADQAGQSELSLVIGPLDTEQQAEQLWKDHHFGDAYEIVQLSSPNIVLPQE